MARGICGVVRIMSKKSCRNLDFVSPCRTLPMARRNDMRGNVLILSPKDKPEGFGDQRVVEANLTVARWLSVLGHSSCRWNVLCRKPFRIRSSGSELRDETAADQIG